MKSTTCDDVSKLFARVEDELSGSPISTLAPQERVSVSRHVRECEKCMSAIEQQIVAASGSTDIVESIQDGLMLLRDTMRDNGTSP